jgi:glycerol-3-phosphate O-acyltransferase
MKNLFNEFNKIENKDTDKIDKLLKKTSNFFKENEKLIVNNKKEEISQLSSEQYKQFLNSYEISFKILGGLPAITMKATTLSELFKSIYVAGMKKN